MNEWIALVCPTKLICEALFLNIEMQPSDIPYLNNHDVSHVDKLFYLVSSRIMKYAYHLSNKKSRFTIFILVPTGRCMITIFQPIIIPARLTRVF